jgi:hypothetical protein
VFLSSVILGRPHYIGSERWLSFKETRLNPPLSTPPVRRIPFATSVNARLSRRFFNRSCGQKDRMLMIAFRERYCDRVLALGFSSPCWDRALLQTQDLADNEGETAFGMFSDVSEWRKGNSR